jgi:hypothetical protein
MVWLIAAAPAKTGMQFPTWFTIVYLVGFVAAVGLGSLAWYNSRRPAGWEDSERPSFIPEISTQPDDTPEA